MAGILIISRIRSSGKEGKEESKCARKRLARALRFVFFFFIHQEYIFNYKNMEAKISQILRVF